MAAGIFNLTGSYAIERGACYSFTADFDQSTGEYNITDYLISGFTYRKWDDKPGPNFTCTALTPSSGIVEYSYTASQTQEFSLDAYRHESFFYPPSGGCPVRVLQGDIEINGGGII